MIKRYLSLIVITALASLIVMAGCSGGGGGGAGPTSGNDEPLPGVGPVENGDEDNADGATGGNLPVPPDGEAGDQAACPPDSDWAAMFSCTDAPEGNENEIGTVNYIGYAQYLEVLQSPPYQGDGNPLFTPEMLKCVAQHECKNSNYAYKISDCISTVTFYDAVDECGYSNLLSTTCRPDSNWSEVYSCNPDPDDTGGDYVSFDTGINALKELYGTSKTGTEIVKMANCIALNDCQKRSADSPNCLSLESYVRAADRCNYDITAFYDPKLSHVDSNGNPAEQNVIYTLPASVTVNTPSNIAFHLWAKYLPDKGEDISNYEYSLCVLEPGTNNCGEGDLYQLDISEFTGNCRGQFFCKVNVKWLPDLIDKVLEKYQLLHALKNNNCITIALEWNISNNAKLVASSRPLDVRLEIEPNVCPR